MSDKPDIEYWQALYMQESAKWNLERIELNNKILLLEDIIANLRGEIAALESQLDRNLDI